MNILSIGGSDPSAGAGIQSDIKVCSTLGAYCFTVITSITSQNSNKFSKTEPVSIMMIKSQIDSILSDFKIDVIKIGMVYNSDIIKAVNSKLRKLKIPIIVDPVIESTTGGNLLKKDSLKNYKKYIIPLAHVITPNVLEAEILSEVKIKRKNDLEKSALKIKNLGVKNVIITGHSFTKNKISDFILENSIHYTIHGNKILKKNHGSGCTFSMVLSYYISKKMDIREAALLAKRFTYESIKNSISLGKGISITHSKKDNKKETLHHAINDFVNIKNSYCLIPECQTNFVYSKLNPKTIKDVLGISGRIVKAGKNCLISGDLEYGASKHVASAVVEISKKFPEIRSAINIKFEKKSIQKFKKENFVILNYDRKNEPKKIKNQENLTVRWGIKKSICNSKKIPDIIYHEGDFGKEAMILIFGKSPKNVIDKISKII